MNCFWNAISDFIFYFHFIFTSILFFWLYFFITFFLLTSIWGFFFCFSSFSYICFIQFYVIPSSSIFFKCQVASHDHPFSSEKLLFLNICDGVWESFSVSGQDSKRQNFHLEIIVCYCLLFMVLPKFKKLNFINLLLV